MKAFSLFGSTTCDTPHGEHLAAINLLPAVLQRGPRLVFPGVVAATPWSLRLLQLRGPFLCWIFAWKLSPSMEDADDHG